ncbi:BA14K family protein [Bradyrhizobium sp. 139]|uniref:BA14K family protein n=1 Tax=Bradyrhizobium sp. 139 TaxID=2782616 RepID=UPI001FFB47BC|nr:BA14K family protein [Bradyrhizobium sp. 139]MCK1744272.1 BA14K family protein [Bradyrhizobium sp. 139]
MRYPIETAPRNGSIVVLDASGTLEVAYWSPTGEWIGEYGEPSEITPSHWHPCYSFFQSSSRREAPQSPTVSEFMALRSAHARQRFVVSWIAPLVLTMVLVGIFIQPALLHPQAPGEERARSAAIESAYATVRRGTETTGIALSHNKSDDEVAERAQALRAMEQKSAAVDEKPAAKQSEGVAPENGQPEVKAAEAVPPKSRAVSQNVGYGCQHYLTYDPASGTYKGYDGRRRSCRPQAPSQRANPGINESRNVAIGIRADFIRNLR